MMTRIHTSSRAGSSASFRSLQLLLPLLLLLLSFFTHLSSAQTVTEVITRTTGSASLNTATRTPNSAASATSSAPQVTSTTIPELQLSGPQVPFLLQEPIPAQYDDLAKKVTTRMKDVYFTGCPADQVNYVEPALRINISAVYTQFDPVLGSDRHLTAQNQYDSGVLRIVAVGATDSVGRTVNTNVTPQLLSTLSVETEFLTFSVFRNDSYLCDSLYPVSPDPNGTVVNGVVIEPAGCLYGPGQVSLGVGIPLNDTYTLGTLWTRIRLSDTSSPALDIACFEVHVSPYDDAKWYWRLIFWFPIALAIGYFVVIALARVFCALTSRARAFKNKAREGSQPNVIKDTIAPTLVSAISGQKLALSAALLRFATPGCWDIIFHTQFVAAISMVAVRWPEFSYVFFKQAAWSTLTGNVTIIRPADLDSQFDLLATNASLPSGDISTQFSNLTSPLYMNEQAPNRFTNLDGARAGMDAYAHAVGLRPRDLFGTCLSIWFFILAAIVAISVLVWIVDSFHDTLLRLQKHREDGYSLNVADAPLAAETKEMVDDEPRSSLSRRGGYRFLGADGKRLFGSSDNTFHLRMLHGNVLRAITLFHLPITIFTTYQMANADIFSATSVGLAGLAFAFLSVLAPVYAVFCISRAPTAKLYDSIGTLSAFGAVYNNYSPGSQLFCAVDFARTFVMGVVIGAGQQNGSAQSIIILVFEIMFALACGLWLPWGEGAMMGPVSFVANVLRIFTAVMILLLSPLVDLGREAKGWLAYVILLLQAILYVCAGLILLVKMVEGVVRLVGRASFDERASTRLSGLGGAIRKINKKKEGKLQLNKKGNKRPSQTRDQLLDRSTSTNTQNLMLASLAKESSTGENTPAVPSSPRKLSTSLPSTMSMNRIPVHSRQASYASYLDSQFQGRKSPADMLADGNGPYSTYLRGDPHDEGFIMAALPHTAANGRAVSPPPLLHQWSGRQSPPPAAQSGFVRMGGGRATDSAPYQALHGHGQGPAPGQLPRPLSSGSIERTSPPQHLHSLPPQRRARPLSQSAVVESYFDLHRQSMPPSNQDDNIGLSSTEAAARNATIRRYSQGAQLRASQSIAGMMAVDEEGQPIVPASKKQKGGKFWKRGGGARSDSDSDDDDDDDDDDQAAFRSRGGWRGLNKMTAAMSSLAARLGGGKTDGAIAEEGNNSLEPPASEADVSGTRQNTGFEVVRPQRPRRSSAAAERALDSTALAAAAAAATSTSTRDGAGQVHPSPTPTAVQPYSSTDVAPVRSGTSRGAVSAADAYSMPANESQHQQNAEEVLFDASSGTLPPGAAQQALLLPHRTSNRPTSAVMASSSSKPAVNEDMFWVSTSSRPQSYASRPVSSSSSRMMAAALSGSETRDSRQQVSTSSSKGRIAEPMQAEVVNAEELSSSEGRTPPAVAAAGTNVDPIAQAGAGAGAEARPSSMFDADGQLVSSAINFDRRQSQASAFTPATQLVDPRVEESSPRQVWDAAQAYK